MSESNIWPYAETKLKSYRTPSFLLGRIEGLALALKSSSDVDVTQAADAIIRDVALLAEALEQQKILPPITVPCNVAL